MAQPKKTKKKLKRYNVPRIAADPLHTKRLIGSAIGAAIGSAIGIAIAEDPSRVAKLLEGFGSAIKEGALAQYGIGPVHSTGRAGSASPGSKETLIRWYAAEDGIGHAYYMAFDSNHPCVSVCGDEHMDEPPSMPGIMTGQCQKCLAVLSAAGISTDAPPETPSGKIDADFEPPKKAKHAKKKSAPHSGTA